MTAIIHKTAPIIPTIPALPAKDFCFIVSNSFIHIGFLSVL
jgi:hypothetical protein